MKKLLAFILLISHVNFSMFIAQVDEVDIYDTNGQQLEDINSLVQYIADVCHLHHKPIKDSDDDNARYFHLEKLDYSVSTQLIRVIRSTYRPLRKTDYPPFIQKRIASIFIDVTSPPPKAETVV